MQSGPHFWEQGATRQSGLLTLDRGHLDGGQSGDYWRFSPVLIGNLLSTKSYRHLSSLMGHGAVMAIILIADETLLRFSSYVFCDLAENQKMIPSMTMTMLECSGFECEHQLWELRAHLRGRVEVHAHSRDPPLLGWLWGPCPTLAWIWDPRPPA